MASVTARAALAGNPSDGYGGFVVAVPVRSCAATVTATPADRFVIAPTGDDTFGDLEALVDHVDQHGYSGSRQLVLATIRALVRHHGADLTPTRIELSTTIPRSVGLSGSSAIVIATLRALIDLHPHTDWAQHLATDPDALARLALGVETNELSINAGLQDRLVQAHGRPVAMDFTTGTTRPVDTSNLPLFVAYRPAAAAPSGDIHRSLHDRYFDNEGTTRELVHAIAEAGRAAATAIDADDRAALGAAMDATLDLRAELLPLDAGLLAAAHAVRAAGGHANWSGSGGAITVLAGNATDLRTLLRTEHGCELLDV